MLVAGEIPAEPLSTARTSLAQEKTEGAEAESSQGLVKVTAPPSFVPALCSSMKLPIMEGAKPFW